MGAGASAFEPELSSLSCDELHGTLMASFPADAIAAVAGALRDGLVDGATLVALTDDELGRLLEDAGATRVLRLSLTKKLQAARARAEHHAPHEMLLGALGRGTFLDLVP